MKHVIGVIIAFLLPVLTVALLAWDIWEVAKPVAPRAWQIVKVPAGKLSQSVQTSAQRTWQSTSTHIRQGWGTFKFGRVAPSTPLRKKHMAALYRKQDGRDGLCGNPLPNLYVGWLWERRFNPDIEIDHIKPKSRGGSDNVSNLHLTHRNYNRAKGALVGAELRKAKRQFCPVGLLY